MKEEAAVELIHAYKVYRTRGVSTIALRNVSLRVDYGAMLCVMGASGSGKTTLLKVAAGYLSPDDGQVRLLGLPVYSLPIDERLRVRRLVGFMFQEDLLIDTLTLLENVELPLVIEGASGKERSEAAMRALESVGLAGKEDRRPDEVSGGERRRASLARCLTREPKILFADEPTSNLDSNTAHSIVETLRALNKGGATIILSTHDQRVAEQTGNTIYIRDGAIQPKP